MPYGPFWKRAVALLIDLPLFVALYSAAIVGLNWLLNLRLRGLEFQSSIFELREWDLRSTVIMLSIKLVVALAYFAGFEASALRATPGKLLAGLQVTDMAGERISFSRAAARLLVKVLSGAAAGLGYALAGFTRHRQALHDLIASTLVVRRRGCCAHIGGAPLGVHQVPRIAARPRMNLATVNLCPI